MKLANFLSDLGDFTTYHPALVPVCGSVTATIFLCRLYAWKGKEKDLDGWIYKTVDEMEEETGMSRWEQEGARKKLKSRGLLKEKLAGLPAKLHYWLDEDALQEAWDANHPPENHRPCSRKTIVPVRGISANWSEEKRQIPLLNNRDSNTDTKRDSSSAGGAAGGGRMAVREAPEQETELLSQPLSPTPSWPSPLGDTCTPTAREIHHKDENRAGLYDAILAYWSSATSTTKGNARLSRAKRDAVVEAVDTMVIAGKAEEDIWHAVRVSCREARSPIGLLLNFAERARRGESFTKPTLVGKRSMGERTAREDRASQQARLEAIAAKYGMQVYG